MHLYKCKLIIIESYNDVNGLRGNRCKKVDKMNLVIEKKIGNNVRRLRERGNLTQETLAAKLQLCGCDITRSAVAKIEVGQRHLYPDEIMYIKRILNVSYEEIFDCTTN